MKTIYTITTHKFHFILKRVNSPLCPCFGWCLSTAGRRLWIAVFIQVKVWYYKYSQAQREMLAVSCPVEFIGSK